MVLWLRITTPRPNIVICMMTFLGCESFLDTNLQSLSGISQIYCPEQGWKSNLTAFEIWKRPCDQFICYVMILFVNFMYLFQKMLMSDL